MPLSSSSPLRATAVTPVAGAPAFAPAKGIDAGSFLQVLGAWLWLPQAALLAWAVQQLAQGAGAAVMLRPVAGLLVLGLLRSGCEAWGLRRVFLTARAQLTALRAQVAVALAQRSPLDSERPASGLAASVMAEQAEAVVPWLVRYQPARWRVMLVLPVIAIAVATLSWVAALVLVLAAPLIPLFMALVGWRAKAASEAHMLELGGLNAFLLDRLRGLSTLRALGAVDATALRLRDAAQALRQRTMAVLRIAFLSSAVLELFAALGVAMVAVYIGFHLLGTLEFGAWGVLAVAASAIAVVWNMVFNTLFERWESRQAQRGRTLRRRLAHAVGFEGRLVLALVPMMAWWFNVTLWQALVMDLGLIVFFLCYTFAFNWVFDRIFGLPASAQTPG